MPLVLKFDTAGRADEVDALALVGGKAANLMRLVRAGFAVPPGFVITTNAYRRFVSDNGLEEVIASAEPGQIRSAFAAASIPADVRSAVLAAQRDLGQVALAVRSSATAEDLPDLSFAGQQDSFLNVVGAEQLLRRVIDCWASLFTHRAVAYRRAAQLDESALALAVVVQELIDADVSGVLFTANPVTGVRGQVSIDATRGLGEALVSGQIEPDHYLLDKSSGRVIEQRGGSKAVVTRVTAGGGVETVSAEPGDLTLTECQLESLGGLARDLEAEYGLPQDAEWVIAEDRLWIVQSRAITTIFDRPRALGSAVASDDDFAVWLSFGAVQGVLGPITPLGRDAIGHIAAGAAAMVGATSSRRDVWFLGEAGERLWIRIDRALRHPLGRRVLPRVVGLAEPGSVGTLRRLLDDPRLAPRRPSLGSGRGLLQLAGAIAPNLIRTQAHPQRGRARFDATAALVVERVRQDLAAAEQGDQSSSALLARRASAAVTGLGSTLRVMFPAFAPIMLPSMAQLAVLNRLAAGTGQPLLPLDLLRGLTGNVTTEMDLALWQVAQEITAADEHEVILDNEPDSVAMRFADHTLGTATQAAVTGFLQGYGMRGVAEIDLGRRRWREDPTPVFATLRSYLSLRDGAAPPDVQYLRAIDAAELAMQQLPVLLSGGLFSLLRSGFARFASRRIRTLLGARETPKFTIIQVMGMVREKLLDSGRRLVADEVLDVDSDIAFLTLDELTAAELLTPAELRSHWGTLVQHRKARYERERRRRAVPRLLCSDGRAFYGGAEPGTDPEKNSIVGTGVSPGVVEGLVRVVDDPHSSTLQSGEILVCAGTDPAWTPLFLAAGGLITEVGGMMTHGSVVAREYGIPAAVGVYQATSRLTTGTRIRLDGGTGTITVFDTPTD